MPARLTITKPFKSSTLALPPSSFSPKLPLSSSNQARATTLNTHRTKNLGNATFPPPPAEPLRWQWQCHICNRIYALGVTRRCLDDGHYFCAGTTVVKKGRKSKKVVRQHKACASEFDYAGWKTWSVWRRDVVQQIKAAEALERMLTDDGKLRAMEGLKVLKKDCWSRCDYPSECRWGREYGVQTPAVVSVPSSPLLEDEEEEQRERDLDTIFEDVIMYDAPDWQPEDSELQEADVEGHLEPQLQTTPPPLQEEAKQPSVVEVLESAKRRKRRSQTNLPSPLASNPPEEVPADGTVLEGIEGELRKALESAGAVVNSFVLAMRKSSK